MDSERVPRFVATERALHWVHGIAFSLLMFTGLVLYLPMFARVVADRPLMKAVHLTVAALWLTALALVVLLGDRKALRRTRAEIERLDVEDIRWLRRRPTARPGRFNAGQKLHAVAQAALSLLFVVSGTFIWLGERNTALRLPGSIALHDAAMFASGALVLGHVYLAFAPDTRASITGLLDGRVDRRYALRHHPRWTPPLELVATPRAGLLARALALVVAGAGLAGAVALVYDIYR